MAMLDKIVNSFEYPLLKSLYSGKAIKHTEWLDELKKDCLPDKTIVEIIFFFQFIISCIIKSLSFLDIRKDLLYVANDFFIQT